MTSTAHRVGAVVIAVLAAGLVGAVLGFPSPLGLITWIRDMLPRALQFYHPQIAQIAVTVTLVAVLGVLWE